MALFTAAETRGGSIDAGRLFHGPAAAGLRQAAGATTGGIEGRVTDATGAVLPDVTVRLSSDALMGEVRTSTNERGEYRFTALSPGEYTLRFEREGFESSARDAIYVRVALTTTAHVEMAITGLEETTIVSRRATGIDRTSPAIATTFDRHQLASLPNSRSVFAVLSATPAVRVQRLEVGGGTGEAGGPYAAYGTSGLNRPMVEGISVAGIFPSGFTLDFGSFEQVSVGAAAHGAEWSTPGVHMQFISKSGGNGFRATLYADYENRAWQAVNIDSDQIRRGARGSPEVPARRGNQLWSYHDVNADAGGHLVQDALWYYASVRNQEIATHLVNFPVTPHRTHLRNYTGKLTYQLTPGHRFVAFGQPGRTHLPYRLDPFGPAGGGLNATTAINESVDSTTEQRAWGWVAKAEWNAVFGDRFFAEARAGEFGSNRPERSRSSEPRFEDIGTLVVRGGNRDWQSDLRRDQVLASVSHFRDGPLGMHHLKVGGEVFRTTSAEIWRRSYSSDVLHVLRNGAPLEVYLLQSPSRSESGLWTYGGFFNDAWRPHTRLSLNLGARFDRYRVFLPPQVHPVGRFNPEVRAFAAVENVISWNLVAPRLGATAALAADGATVARLTYGHYWIPPGTEVGANANPNATTWWRRHVWTDIDGSGVWEAGEEGRLLDSRGGVALEDVDPALKLQMMREVTASFEHELPGAVVLRTGLVWRGTTDGFMRQNVRWPFDAFTVPLTVDDPGPDGQLGSGDDAAPVRVYQLPPELLSLPPLNRVRNVADSADEYWTGDVSADRRFSGRWSLVAGFSHTWHQDHANAYVGQSVRQNLYPLTPNDLLNTGHSGRHESTTWTARVHGTIEGAWGLRVTPHVRHQSGQPFGRTFSRTLNYGNVRFLAEPIGTRRMDTVTLVDVRVEKRVRLWNTHRLTSFIDVFNLFNANPEQNVSWASGTFLRPLNIVAPRIARVGFRAEW